MDDFATELHRLLLGDYPWWFLLEVLLRSWLIYIVLFITMRLMGKRMAAQLSISELAVMITLGGGRRGAVANG
jgi:uncharacterized membrane protein YcaP (DUF421 family)